MTRTTVTYTMRREDGQHVEATETLHRNHYLTDRGAARIVRRMHPGAMVSRVETVAVES